MAPPSGKFPGGYYNYSLSHIYTYHPPVVLAWTISLGKINVYCAWLCRLVVRNNRQKVQCLVYTTTSFLFSTSSNCCFRYIFIPSTSIYCVGCQEVDGMNMYLKQQLLEMLSRKDVVV